MNQVLLETIIEKLEGLEISLLKNTLCKDSEEQQELLKEIRSYQSAIAPIFHQIKTANEKINELTKNVAEINFSSVNKASGHIHHKHHLHNGMWIAIILFITSVFLLYGWINSYTRRSVSEANDIKYRYLKVNGNKVLLKVLYRTDSLYNLNKQFFVKVVTEKEDFLVQQVHLNLIDGKEKKEVK